MPTKSRAVVMRRTGPPEVLVCEEVVLAPLAPGEVRLRTLASAVNHSDLEIRAGNWRIQREPRFPYVPGLEVVGEVVEVAPGAGGFAVGDRAWTTMQGLGGVRAVRDGGYAEHVTVAAAALAPLSADVDAAEFAALGLAGVTALEGMRRLGPLAGKTLIVTGVSGGVGAVAVGMGEALGAAAGGEVSFDAWSLLDGRVLTGYSTEELDGDALRTATRELLDLKLPRPPTRVLALAEAASAHALLERRAVRGRVVLVP